MKFLCDSCGTKYSISDERVRGRVLKIRCKKCDFVITVREDAAAVTGAVVGTEEVVQAVNVPPQLAPAPFEEERTAIGALSDDKLAALGGAAPGAPEVDDWFVSFDGEQEGPYSLARAKERVVAEKPGGKEAHAWRPGFLVWLPVEEVPELEMSAGKATPVRAATFTPIGGNAPAAIQKDPSGPRAALSVSAGAKPAPKPDAKTAPPPIPGAPQSAGLFAQTAPSPAPGIQSMFPAGAPQDDDLEDEEDSSHGSDIPDLPISNEASGLVNLAHLAQAAMGQKPAGPVFVNGHTARATSARAPMSTLDVPEVPADGGPVVVVAGAAPGGANPVFKYLTFAAIPILLGLVIAVVYLATHRPAGETIVVTEPSRHRDDSPITMNDPGAAVGAQVDPKRAGAKHPVAVTAGTAKPPTQPAVAAKPGEPLSGSQRSLADLYKEDGDKATPHAITGSGHGEPQGGQVSQAAIIAAVNANKRQLTACYDRALKHDGTMKSGRVPIQVTVGMSGRVTKVSIPEAQYASSELGECFIQAVKRWSFPASDAEYSTEFPFILQGQ